MPTVRTEIDVDAPPEIVWQLITAPDGRDWDPFFARIAGTLEPGERLDVALCATYGGMRFRPRVDVADAPHELVWTGRFLIPGLVDGRHGFRLTRRAGGGTHLEHREEFRGLLVPLAGRVVRDAGAGFAAFNSALKARAEHPDTAPATA
ncbi:MULTISPECIES: SRPBCC domain-containing protein [Pseudonocardia]|uniref:Polyketide cyclase / dehydrase and lipid transport n=2 Tax=Pseudonocardia TaxID=1847 RepID=A0A1Y2N5R5_PSEAH|nr:MULTISPECIES: SRPBCC domain-containing protein [Pseudonocardia]OSY42802.1 Polyketide cyclase / dehydrase and lipid transport [Pseudonocardia autotrophica]TDN77379.1 hypothetical protein C8E95_6625 [Pseudonocardia autotrophica]BBG01402.1 hypothetical protein Pdca_26110 [Pseudonocardia autotrophica]GEC24458.1 hypothetical protein PSA01_14870 [Pseudonocardia saturnea]